MARPQKPASVIGVSINRLSPYFFQRPRVILYAPSNSATSSPNTNTFSSRASSSSRAAFNASRTVIFVIGLRNLPFSPRTDRPSIRSSHLATRARCISPSNSFRSFQLAHSLATHLSGRLCFRIGQSSREREPVPPHFRYNMVQMAQFRGVSR